MVAYKLVYFGVRGLGEPIRVILHYAGENFEDKKLTFEEFSNYKKTSKFGLIPVLELNDGRKLNESQAIGLFLGKKFGLSGKDEWEEAQIYECASFHKDVLAEFKDYIRSFVPIYSTTDERKIESKKEALKAAETKFPLYVKLLKESGSGFLIKSGITWIDFFVNEFFTTINNILPGLVDKYDELVAYQKRIHNHPKLKDYFEKRPESLL